LPTYRPDLIAGQHKANREEVAEAARPSSAFTLNVELMTQYHDLRFQLPSRLEAIAQHADEQEADCNHVAIMF
jgi:hypothetical protein